jgi:glycosyltransferase involved in cell wall biosynthesis
MSNGKHRILVVSHGHPDFSLGGGEIAAYNLFRAYRECSDVEASFFLARHYSGRSAIGAISPRRSGEFLWETSVCNGFKMEVNDPNSLQRSFSDLIWQLRLDVVHVHHYVHMGLEYLQVIKKIAPSIRIVMTLHEYMAICYNDGQMIKRGSGRLCNYESPEDCRNCFPEHSVEDFWLRKHRYQRYFDLVDQFVAPSNFLRTRYINWGIAPEKIQVIENGQADRNALPPRPLKHGESRNRFGFFGQVNPYKGIELLLRALAELPKEDRRKLALEVHGTNLNGQTEDFQAKIGRLRKRLEKDGTLQWIGHYEPIQIEQRHRTY